MGKKFKNFYFTFCLGASHQHCGGKFHIVKAKDAHTAREKMVARFGRDWAFQYTEEEWFANGVSQQVKFNLREVK
ncbi:MAG: hypothetical protein ACE5D4_09735 [Thermodesulfobacteriota bacterium]